MSETEVVVLLEALDLLSRFGHSLCAWDDTGRCALDSFTLAEARQ